MITQAYEPRIERISRVWQPDAKLYVPHQDTEVSFAAPTFGPNTYQSIGKEILSHNLKLPIGDYTASLLHTAYCDLRVSNEPEFKNVRDIMRNKWLWVFNQCLWTDKGVYVISDLKGLGRSEEFDNKKLGRLERLVNAKGLREVNGVRFSKDNNVRFAPLETYKLGDHTAESLSQDGFVIASYDIEGAKKLAEVSTKFSNNPRTYGVTFSEGNSPELRVSALGECGSRLHVVGYWDDYGRCYAFGVL